MKLKNVGKYVIEIFRKYQLKKYPSFWGAVKEVEKVGLILPPWHSPVKMIRID